MSPEQAEMSGLDIDTRSEIYSLGAVLSELLAGSTPFDAKELMASGIDAMRKTIREKEPMRPSTRLAALKGEELTTTAKRRQADAPKLIHLLKGDLDWIVMKCLEMVPNWSSMRGPFPRTFLAPGRSWATPLGYSTSPPAKSKAGIRPPSAKPNIMALHDPPPILYEHQKGIIQGGINAVDRPTVRSVLRQDGKETAGCRPFSCSCHDRQTERPWRFGLETAR